MTKEINFRLLPIGSKVMVRTQNTTYVIEKGEGGDYIQRSPKYCDEFVYCHIHGSTFGGCMLKVGFIVVGMYMEFSTSKHPETILTSEIQEVRVQE